MDHLARIAMKNAANCVKYGELQGFRNRYMSNAYCGPVIHLTGPRLSEGLLNCNKRFVAAMSSDRGSRVLGLTPSRLGVAQREIADETKRLEWRVLPVRSHRGENRGMRHKLCL